MTEFKTPDPRMAGFITVVLLTLFAFSYVVPVLNLPWIKDGAEFDPALQQNLLLLLVLAVGYYIGSTKASEDKNAVIATQATTAAAVVAAAAPALASGSALTAGASAPDAPTGRPDDPVTVAVAEEDPGLAAFKELAKKLNPDATDDQIATAWAAMKASKPDVALP